MRASLPSRDLIADSVELVARGEGLDGLVLLAGCDKTVPGMLMAAARLNCAAVLVYAGTIAPGRLVCDGIERDITLVDVWEGVGANASGRMSDAELCAIEKAACPAAGTCGACIPRTVWPRLPRLSGWPLSAQVSAPALDPRRRQFAEESGQLVVRIG